LKLAQHVIGALEPAQVMLEQYFPFQPHMNLTMKVRRSFGVPGHDAKGKLPIGMQVGATRGDEETIPNATVVFEGRKWLVK
jgi:hypothetical protein